MRRIHSFNYRRVLSFPLSLIMTLILLSPLSVTHRAEAATPNFGYFGYTWITDENLEFEFSPPIISEQIREYQIGAQYSQSSCTTNGNTLTCPSYSAVEVFKSISPTSTTLRGSGDLTINSNNGTSRSYKNVQKFSLLAGELRTFLSGKTSDTNRGLILAIRAIYGNSTTEWSDWNFVDPRKLWSTTSNAEVQSEQVVRIGYQGPLTGPESQLGIDQLTATKYAIAKFNTAYSGKYRVLLTEIDDQGDPSISQKVAPGVAANQAIIGLVGPAYSGATISALSSYKPAGLAMISPSAVRIALTDPTNPGGPLGSPVFHRISALDKDQGPAIYRLAIQGVSSPKVFVVDDQSAYGITLFDYMKPSVKEGVIVGSDSVSDRTTDWSATISKIRTSSANAVVFLGYYSQAAVLIKQLRDSGYVGTITSGDGSFSPAITTLAPSSVLEGLRVTSGTAPLSAISNELEADFVKTMGTSSGTYAAESIDATNVLLTCISKGINSRSAMLSCIKSYRGESIYGDDFGFSVYGDNTAARVISFTLKNGSFTLLNSISKNRGVASRWWPWFPSSTNTNSDSAGTASSGSGTNSTAIVPAKPATPKISSVSFAGNTVNVVVNIGGGSNAPDKVYLVAPKLGITAKNPLAGGISGENAIWSIEFDKILGGTTIPLEVVSEKNGNKSETVSGNYEFPTFTPEITMAPAAPKNLATRIVGSSVVITAEAEVKSNALASSAYLFAQSLGIPKNQAIQGDVVGSKVIFELPLKDSMAGKRYPIVIYLSNSKGDSRPLEGTLAIPAIKKPAVKTAPKKPTTPKTVICSRSSQTRTFAGTKCPPGWIKN